MAQTYVVRYGRMRFLGEYTGLPGQDHPRGQKVVVRSDRGTELGDILCPTSERTADFLPNPAQGEILRLATTEDWDQETHLDADTLDRIDALVPPGTTVNPADAGWTPPALADASQRRRPSPDAGPT